MPLTVLAAGPTAYAVLLDELLLDCGPGVLARAGLAGIPVRPERVLVTGANEIGCAAGVPGQRETGRRWTATALDAGGPVAWLVEHEVEGLLLHCPHGDLDVPAGARLTVPNPLLDAPPVRSTRRVLVTGGAASGKSAYAEGRMPAGTVYVATGSAEGDADWQARLDRHRTRRPASWTTAETLDLGGLLAVDGPPLLVDGLGTWLARVLDDRGWDTPGEVPELAAYVARTPRSVTLVTDEVGDGVVPATRSGGVFRDLLGRLNAAVAAECDEVHRVTAGIAQRLR